MPLFQDFEDRLAALFALELRRQGVPDTTEWIDRLRTYSSYVPCNTSATNSDADSSATNSASRHKSHSSCVFVLDLTNLNLGDRVAVALCEALLKVEPANARVRTNEVVEWQLLLRRCGLTDRVLHHLSLLVTGFSKLTVLDVSANTFTDDGQTMLLNAAAEVPCDVIVADGDARACNSITRSISSSPPCDVSSQSSLALNATHGHTKYSKHRQQAQHHKEPQSGAAASAGPSNRKESPGDADASSSIDPSVKSNSISQQQQQQPRLQTYSQIRRLQRSPSLTGTSVSISHSQRSYASGSAEALQRRRKELFGPSLKSAPADAPHERNHSATKEERTDNGNNNNNSSPAGEAAALNATSMAFHKPAEAESLSSSPSPLKPRGATAALGGVNSGSHSPFRTTVTAPHSSSQASGQGSSVTRNRSFNNNKSNATVCKTGADSARDAAESREPFVDRNDQLDMTANLNPMFDSVLDLSALTSRNGVLRQVHMFGGARTLWDVLAAYEEAAEQQQNGSNTSKEGNVDAALRAKLPAALLGGTSYNAITVLNLSRNHLTSLCPLPATLLRLDVSANALTELNGLEPCKMLTVLNARRNQLQQIRGLEKNLGLAHLFLGHNQISLIEGLAHLVLLETLDVTFNQLRTQTSIRMLSLCSALRHVLLRGNPVMESHQNHGFIPVLRNLCPTLLVVDDQRVGSTTLAERALLHRGWGQQPSTFREGSTKDSSHNKSNFGSALSQIAVMSALSGTKHRPSTFGLASAACVPMDASSASSIPFTASRRRDSVGSTKNGACGRRPAPFAVENEDVIDEGALDFLHLLTRGVTAPTGYGDTARTQHAAQHLAQLQKNAAEKEKVQRERRLTANGRPLRGVVVKQLAEESRKYVEDTIVRHLTAQQQQQHFQSTTGENSNLTIQAPPPPAAGGKGVGLVSEKRYAIERTGSPSLDCEQQHGQQQRTMKVAGSLSSPARFVSPKPAISTTAAAAAAALVEVDPAAAEVLKRYELRTKPIKRRTVFGAKPHVATTHAAELRAASARRSVSGTNSRQQSPSRTSTAAPTTAVDNGNGAEGRRGPGGSRVSSAPPQMHPQRQQEKKGNETDATLDAMYVEEPKTGHYYCYYYGDHLGSNSSKEEAYGAADVADVRGVAGTSYAALHLAERQIESAPGMRGTTTRSFDEADIECSPISKDPQARLLTSLNTTASVYERSVFRDPAPITTKQQQQSRSVSPRDSQKAYGVPPTLNSSPSSTAAAATTSATFSEGCVRHARNRAAAPTKESRLANSRRSSSSSKPVELARTHAQMLLTACEGGGPPPPHDPAPVEETAIYPASRSHSRGSRSEASQSSQRTRSTTPTAQAVPGVRRSAAPTAAAQYCSPHRGNNSDWGHHHAATAMSAGNEKRSRSSSTRQQQQQQLILSMHAGRTAAAAASPPSPSSSPARSRSASLRPLYIDGGQRSRVQAWSAQLSEDAMAVQEALQTLVELLEAQRQSNQPFPESSRELPLTYLQERRRCIEIIQESGMLADTQVPMEVVVYYGFSKSELDGEMDRSTEVIARENKSEEAWLQEIAERAEVLRLVHLLGDAKTCLRYVSLLVGDGREKLLQQYVDQLKESLR